MNEVKARALLARFRTAWEARDLDATLDCFDDSGAFRTNDWYGLVHKQIRKKD